MEDKITAIIKNNNQTVGIKKENIRNAQKQETDFVKYNRNVHNEAKKQEKILTLHIKNAILFLCLRQRRQEQNRQNEEVGMFLLLFFEKIVKSLD